ncbi:MAG: UbiH/UbiF family hydroxylase [Pseudomonadota bacterium]|nr:UbiH/UbiF family hydroxylase [Pseudomonadota bacterium]
MTGTEHDIFDVAVIGGGATGFAAALTAVATGCRTVLFAPPATFPPGRTAALLQGSVDILSGLDVWPALMDQAAPLKAIRIVDATKRLIRAPEVIFHAAEIGLPAFGFNVPNGELVAALRGHAESRAELTIVEAPVQSVGHDEDSVTVSAEDEAYPARLVVAADGARSIAREAAGISVRSWTHRQSALVATFAIERPHGGVSTEFHIETGPFTLVPLPGDRVSLVWMDRPQQAERTIALDGPALSRLVEERAFSIHGGMQLDSAPALFPLRAALADRFAARRTILVGEAAHRFPPIGAQGLNLGFRDVAALGRVLSRHRGDPGSPAAVDSYHAARQSDVRGRALAVDLLNRSVLTDFLPVQAARGIGLALASSVPVLRRALMRRGLAEGMRGMKTRVRVL